MTNFVCYYRVSTNRQGCSGLGLEAQDQAVRNYAKRLEGQIIATFVEVESGAARRRPQLDAALAQCRRTKAVLLIAKLDRLARNVAFISSLIEAGVEFVAVDAPYANKLMLHILAAFAEHEREQISARTKAALSAARRRGVKLGTYGEVLAARNRAESLAHAAEVLPTIQAARRAGYCTLQEIADYLNTTETSTASGGKWYPTTVRRVLARAPLTELEKC